MTFHLIEPSALSVVSRNASNPYGYLPEFCDIYVPNITNTTTWLQVKLNVHCLFVFIRLLFAPTIA